MANNAVKYSQPAGYQELNSSQGNRLAIGVVSTLFFLFGFITCLNDILIPHLKEVFALSYTESMLINLLFFGAYFVFSLPASKLITKIGYKNSFIVGLLLTAIGCFSFVFAAKIAIYYVFLCGLFVLASGVVTLQVASNPYLTIISTPKNASSTLIFAQGLNSLGTTLAPILGSSLILAVAVLPADVLQNMSQQEIANYHVAQAYSVQKPYLYLACSAILIAIIMSFFKYPKDRVQERTVKAKHQIQDAASIEKFNIFNYPKLVLGTIAIFVYVGAEVGIGSLMVNYISQSHVGNFDLKTAGFLVTLYWGAAMVGRFIGFYFALKKPTHKILFFHAIMALFLVTCTIFGSGYFAIVCVLAVGFFNSIMFPSIFVLSTQGLGKFVEKGSGIICMAIVGGAVIPMLQGIIADNLSLNASYIVPLLCYLYIAWFAMKVKSEVSLKH
ncbi:MAG: sugar MFS transporter [Spirobacillus cienkowskii]|jgi:FHS family L-fucose permease-like MFS transporter|uniref:Sugar MFS transporter n=1 Tax=Spirobacillus cienkowskii TaxID=495820 RepID=A0A369KVI5_9BACT|nr:MAG: sugar MFS transporter [Spirobacillus cienkowskii]